MGQPTPPRPWCPIRPLILAIALAASACRPRPETIVVVVLDTVRADHTSLCGYPRPNTPFLESLRDARGASVSCHAYSDAPWTLPSHGSLMTGLPVPLHDLEYRTQPENEKRKARLAPLDPAVPTLAERMDAQGYTTMLVSGNPIIDFGTGLHRGFDRVAVADRFTELYGTSLLARAELEVRKVDRDDPLFLFVNVADAHAPWGGVPSGIEWVPPRGPLQFRGVRSADVRRRYMRGELSAAEEKDVEAHNEDVYDYAILQADMTVMGLVALVERHRGTIDKLVVTADHGEYLGDRDLLGHGGTLWEPVVRVPFLALGPGASAVRDGPFAARSLFAWVADGRFPSPPLPVTASAMPSPNWRKHFGGPHGMQTWAAAWEDDSKWLWRDGEVVRFDLSADHDEEHPAAAEAPPELTELATEVEERAARKGGRDLHLELEVLGYVE